MASAECSPPLASDEHLVERVLDGEREAFDQVYARYVGRVYRFVEKRMGNRADVEETVQEVFINVFSSLGSFRAEAPFAAWVLGIARHTIAGRFKKRQHPTVPLDADTEETESNGLGGTRSVTPHDLYELRERIERLETAVARHLTAEQKQLFQLHHIEHLPIAEIAAHLDKSEDAVKSNLYRTRRLLLSR